MKVTSTAYASRIGLWCLMAAAWRKNPLEDQRLGANNLVRRLLRSGGRSCLSHGEDDPSSREYCDFKLLRGEDQFVCGHIPWGRVGLRCLPDNSLLPRQIYPPSPNYNATALASIEWQISGNCSTQHLAGDNRTGGLRQSIHVLDDIKKVHIVWSFNNTPM